MKFSASTLFILSLAAVATAAQIHVSDLFNFVPDVGACGFTNTSQQIVATVSNATFNTYPGATANPNRNPICHHKLFIEVGRKNLTASIVDYFNTKAANNIGLSEVAFKFFAPLEDGIVPNVTWSIL